MPVSLVDPAGFQRATLHVVASGNVTFEEARAFQASLLRDSRLCCGIPLFCDARTLAGVPTTSELRLIAKGMSPLVDAGLGPVAIVCDSSFIYGVARMFAVLAEMANAKVGAFRDVAEAQRWLDGQVSAA